MKKKKNIFINNKMMKIVFISNIRLFNNFKKVKMTTLFKKFKVK